ncbi:hypothetical protein BH20ACT1_BH20ACT1_07810 [soil metagenome]
MQQRHPRLALGLRLWLALEERALALRLAVFFDIGGPPYPEWEAVQARRSSALAALTTRSAPTPASARRSAP